MTTPHGPVVRLTAAGSAPPDLVWERYAEPARWPSWAPQIKGVEPDDVRIHAGLIGVVHGPFGVGVGFEVLSVDERARTWSWRVSPHVAGAALPLTLGLEHAVAARVGGGSTTSLTITAASWLLAPAVIAYAPIARLALSRLVRL